MSAETVEPEVRKAHRGTSNGNSNGNSTDRRRRREWLVETYRADVDGMVARYVGAPPERTDLNTVRLWIPRDQSDYGFAVFAQDIECNPSFELIAKRVPLCRCYRCGELLTVTTVTVDRIIPGCVKTAKYPKGGTYVRENIRPSCGPCNSETGGKLAHLPKHRKAKR